jgi:hypothetical protein
MTTIFSVPAIYFYAMTLFVFSQWRHMKYSSEKAHILLMNMVGLGMLAGIVFLILYAIKTIWWSPFALYGILMLLCGIVQWLICLVIPEWVLSLLGFIAIPVFGFLMFYSL